jgi:NADPH:quinone reductase-like Zn-dependent oxidoreductase
MKAAVIREYGGPAAVRIEDLAEPVIGGPHDVRIAVKAAALNHLDLWVLRGLPHVRHDFPFIPGCDAAGVVESAGPGVTLVRTGQRVIVNPGNCCERCNFCQRGEHSLCHQYGVLGEHINGTFRGLLVTSEANLAPIPDRVGWHEAAAFPLAMLTAYRMLRSRAALRPGESVLIWGIGGGVAQAALQIAKLLGARVMVTSSDDSKLERARELGADAVINHASDDVVKAARAFSGARGVDVVVDSVGQATWEASTRALGRGGRIVTCGGTSGHAITMDIRKLMWHHWSILGSTMGNRAEFAEVAHLFATGRLRPVVDSVVPLAEARRALERLEAGAQFGKIVLDIEG